MSDNRWRNGLATGLVLGIPVTAAVLVWGDGIYDFVQCITREECSGYAQRYNQTDEPRWWYWSRRLIAIEDTLAQWVMSAFTVVAAGLLYGTLRQANKTNLAAVKAAKAATETNEIMRAERRPWLMVEITEPLEFTFTNEKQTQFSYRLKYKVTNKGKMPARFRDVQVRFSRRDWGYIAAGSEDAALLHDQAMAKVSSRAPRIIFPGQEIEGGFWGAVMTIEGVGKDVEHAALFLAVSIAYWLDDEGREVGCTTVSHVLQNDDGIFGPFAYSLGQIAEYGRIS